MNAMLRSSDLPQNLWEEALHSVNHILNKIPHKNKDKSPYELWKGRKPSYNFLKVWECLANVQVPKPKQKRIGPKTIDCVFIRYAMNSSACRFLVHKFEVLVVQKGALSNQEILYSLKILFHIGKRTQVCINEHMILQLETIMNMAKIFK